MKPSLIPVLVAGLVSTTPAFATKITLDFEGPTSFASIDQYYNDGTDSAGASGTDLGVSFGLDALAVRNDALGPYFSNAPSPIGVMAPVGQDATMNVPDGFDGLASFYYSSTAPVTVRIFSGLNGTGTSLGTFKLANNAQTGCSDSPYCHWDFVSFDLGGNVAKSITFGDAENVAGFDNVTVNVPEPDSFALLTLGLAGIGGLTRSRRLAGRKQGIL